MPLAEEATPEAVPEPEPPPEVLAEPEMPAEIVAPPEPAIPSPLVDDHRAVDERPKRGVALRAAWVVSVAALVAAAWFAYSAKDEVMHAWPPSVRVYAALGLTGRH